MSLVLHFFKKDFRRARLLFGIWVLLLVVRGTLMTIGLRPGVTLAASLDAALSGPAPIIEMLVLGVLVALLVQEESPAGSTRFWLTRPMPRASVIGTKALFVGVFVVIFLAVQLSVLASAGIPERDLARYVPEAILKLLQTIVVAGLLAAVTTSFGRFVIAAALYFAGNYLIQLGLFTVVPSNFRATEVGIDFGALVHSRQIVSEGLVVIGVGGALVYQYCRRKTRQSAIVAAGFALLAAVAETTWPINFFPASPQPTREVPSNAKEITLALASTSTQDSFGIRRVPVKEVTGEFRATGLPPELGLVQRGADAELQLPNGGQIPVQPAQHISFQYEARDAMLEAALGASYIYGAPYWRMYLSGSLLTITAENYRQYSSTPARLSAKMEYAVQRFILTGRTPLAVGSQLDDGMFRVHVSRILRDGRGVSVMLQFRAWDLQFGRPPALESRYGTGLESWSGTINGRMYLLVNRRTREVIRCWDRVGERVDLSSGLAPAQVESWVLGFGVERDAPTPVLDEHWLRDAELVELKPVTVGSVTTDVAYDRFILAGTHDSDIRLRPPPMRSDWLTRFVLPANPSRDQLAKYVDDICVASCYWHNDDIDLPVTKLAEVGSGHADLLLAEWDSPMGDQVSRLVLQAVLRVAGPADRDAVLAALLRHPQLAPLVTKFNWARPARGILLAGLANPEKYPLPKDWLLAIAALRDPSSYPALQKYLIHASNRQMTYNSIRKLPGIDLRDSVRQAWKTAQTGTEADRFDGAKMAVDQGYLDALGLLVEVLRRDDRGQPQQLEQAMTLAERYLPIDGDQSELVAWYDAHKGQLVFDPKSRKYVISAAHPG